MPHRAESSPLRPESRDAYGIRLARASTEGEDQMQHCASGDVEVLHDLVVGPAMPAWTVSQDGRERSEEGRDAHLPSGVDQSLLRWGDTRLLLDLLLNAGDLPKVKSRAKAIARVSMNAKRDKVGKWHAPGPQGRYRARSAVQKHATESRNCEHSTAPPAPRGICVPPCP